MSSSHSCCCSSVRPSNAGFLKLHPLPPTHLLWCSVFFPQPQAASMLMTFRSLCSARIFPPLLRMHVNAQPASCFSGLRPTVTSNSGCQPPGRLLSSSLPPTLQPPTLVEIPPECPLDWSHRSLSTISPGLLPAPFLFCSPSWSTQRAATQLFSNLLMLPPCYRPFHDASLCLD